MAAQEKFLDSGLFYIPSRKELIWLLEREEYGSLYVIDADSGAFKYELTPGDFTVRAHPVLRPGGGNHIFLRFRCEGRD